jgi:hypothetical protein
MPPVWPSPRRASTWGSSPKINNPLFQSVCLSVGWVIRLNHSFLSPRYSDQRSQFCPRWFTHMSWSRSLRRSQS